MDESESLGNRAKRQKIDKTGRSAALEKLRSLKGSKNKCNVGEIENVYEYVDEKEYSKRVLQRQDEDWLENPGDGYVEDGREIFDDEYEPVLNTSKKTSTKKKKNNLQKTQTSSKSILHMVANMPVKKVKAGESDILNLLDDSLNTKTNVENSSSQKSEPLSSREYLKMLSSSVNSKTSTKAKPHLKGGKTESSLDDGEDILNHSFESEVNLGVSELDKTKTFSQQSINSQNSENWSVHSSCQNFKASASIDYDMNDSEMTDAWNLDEINFKENDKKIDGATDSSKIGLPQNAIATGGQEDFTPAFEEMFLSDGWEVNSLNENVTVQNVAVDVSDLPLTTNNDGESVFLFYWWDAYEDPVKQPGVVYLFGKVYYKKKDIYLSCCVAVENVQRRIFLLPREKRFDSKTNEVTDSTVTLLDVYQEFNDKIANPNKIMNFKSRKATLKYAFDLPDVPLESDYLEIKYPAIYSKLAQDLSGETFSRVFGTNATSLELLLLERKIKGPCWLEVKNPQASKVQCSWCKFETRCQGMENLIVRESDAPPPPLVLMALNIRTVVSDNMDNEVVMIGVLVNNKFEIDKPAPKMPFNSHFCSISRSPNLFWPPKMEEFLAKFKKTEVIVHQVEKSLLNHFLTKLFTIDPDVIIGHELLGFTIDTLVQRIQRLKIPNWSRIGRLRRAIIPQLKGKQADKSIACGRLICDVVTSARELIRARSYDLNTLCSQVLGVEKTNRQDLTSEEIKEKFEGKQTIASLINDTMEDTSCILRILYEMNVLPLSLQITKIAGNVMSKTLLGGRSERNEFLLLHAFTEKNYLVPDKSYAKRPRITEEGEEMDEGVKGGSKKRPQYAGGLVLEPKKGFYDKFILLMDFNSLYPSIIQEYNICFTTITRTQDESEELECSRDMLPGILPTEIQKLVESRREVKAIMKSANLTPEMYMQHNIRQMALKLTANSMYGCLGFAHSRFYAKPLAALVTSKGREILMKTKGIVETMNYDVIYGDTDSIMINTNSTNYEDVFIIGNKIKEEINKLYTYVELEVDGVFQYMLLLRKKKYAAVVLSKNPSGQLVATKEYKGLDIVRRDWCQLSAEIGRNVLNQILSDLSLEEKIANIKEHLEKIADDFKNHRVPTTLLAITKQLTKNPDDYPDAKSLPHLRVALRMNAKGGKKLRAGNTVSYVICDDGTSNPPAQRAYHTDEMVANSELLVDVKYYLTQQIHPVVNRLCEPMDGIDSAFIAVCLGLDPSSYQKVIRQAEKDPESSYRMDDYVLNNDLEAFKRCEQFSFVCQNENCGTTIFMDGPFRDDVKALSKCRNPACSTPPFEYLGYISRELNNKIREHVGRFYENWMICENPSCTNRTRRVPMRFSNSFPVCTLCHKGVMYREYSSSDLYYQIKFYKYIFQLKREVDDDYGDGYANSGYGDDKKDDFDHKNIRENDGAIESQNVNGNVDGENDEITEIDDKNERNDKSDRQNVINKGENAKDKSSKSEDGKMQCDYISGGCGDDEGNAKVPDKLENAYKVLHMCVKNAIARSAYNSLDLGRLFSYGSHKVKLDEKVQTSFMAMRL